MCSFQLFVESVTFLKSIEDEGCVYGMNPRWEQQITLWKTHPRWIRYHPIQWWFIIMGVCHIARWNRSFRSSFRSLVCLVLGCCILPQNIMRNCVGQRVQRSSNFVLEEGYIGSSGFYLGKHDLGMHGVCVLDRIIRCLQLSLWHQRQRMLLK